MRDFKKELHNLLLLSFIDYMESLGSDSELLSETESTQMFSAIIDSSIVMIQSFSCQIKPLSKRELFINAVKDLYIIKLEELLE